MKELAEKLINLEHSFNERNVIPMGSLLADFWREVYSQANGKEIKKLTIHRSLLIILKQNIKYIKHSLIRIDGRFSYINKIIISKSGQKNHHNKLIDYIDSDLSEACLFEGDYTKFAVNIGFINVFKVLTKTLIYFIKNYRNINNSVRIYLDKEDFGWVISLYINLLYFFLCEKFFDKNSPKLILVDYDRQKFLPLVLAAKSLNIRTISLQHGAINPPYGYVPLIADEIWVWGTLWKENLIQMGVNEHSIHIVGSTIVDDYQEPKSNRKIKTIGIGPNPIGVAKNEKLWKGFTSILCSAGFKVVVKFHPSMKKNQYAACFHNGCEIYQGNELENHKFFEIIDLLIVSNSGLGYECVVAGTPVAVLRENSSSLGNDSLMIDQGGFWELNDSENLLLSIIKKLENSYSAYILEQQHFLKTQVFAYTGTIAQHQILNKLKNAS